MGPSGSGKTTLLDVLAMRKTLGRVEGTVLVDGCGRRPGAFQRASAYIPELDALLPTLTVLETMQYHAEMRMSPRTPLAEKRARVEEVLRLVGLRKALHTAVGGALPGGLTLRGLSGGERRRLSIAVSMLPRPALVFADEPTSGLDALASLKVLQVFKDVASSGRVVVLTLHQPRAAIWQLFDRLYLLSEGRLMYTGLPSQGASWFETLGYSAPVGCSPADWLLDLVSVGFDKGPMSGCSLNSAADVEAASFKFRQSAYMRSINEELQAAFDTSRGGGPLWPHSGSAVERSGVARWLHQFRTLLWRHALNYHRNVGNVAARLCLAAASGLAVGFCYSGLAVVDARDPHTIPDRLGAIFFMCIVLMITPNCTMALFCADRRFYVVESASQLYGPLAYYLPMALCELVLNVAGAMLFWVPVWGLSGMRRDLGVFVWGFLSCSLVQLCGAQIVNFSALLLPSQELAFVLSVALNIFAFITSGTLVKTHDLVAPVRALRFFSPVKLGIQALAICEIADRDFSNARHLESLHVALDGIASRAAARGHAGGDVPAWWLRQQPLRNLAGNMLDQALPCVDPCVTGMVAKGSEALDCLGLDEPSTVLFAAVGMLLQLAALHVAGYLCLRHLQRERR